MLGRIARRSRVKAARIRAAQVHARQRGQRVPPGNRRVAGRLWLGRLARRAGMRRAAARLNRPANPIRSRAKLRRPPIRFHRYRRKLRRQALRHAAWVRGWGRTIRLKLARNKWWKRQLATATKPAAGPPPKTTPPPIQRPKPASPVTPPVGRPKPAAPISPTTGRNIPMGGTGHPAVDHAVHGMRHVSGYHPKDGPDLDHFLAALPDAMFGEIAKHLYHLADRAQSEWPLEPEVVDSLRQGAQHIMGVGESYRQVYAAWRQAHADDIRRWEAPRPGEPMLNVPR